MLAELLEYCSTPAEPWARKLGYLKEAIAIKARHRRCRAAWADHLARSKTAISRLAAEIGGGRTVVALGAGACLDVLLEDLAARFAEVRLVDAAHLRFRRIARLKNVTRITRDLTGIARAVMASPTRPPQPPALDWLLDDGAIDLVISANTASQLSVIPLAYMNKLADVEEESRSGLHHALLRRHFEWFAQFDCPVLILCDAVRRLVDIEGRVLAEDLLLGDLAPGAPVESWRWPVARRARDRRAGR